MKGVQGKFAKGIRNWIWSDSSSSNNYRVPKFDRKELNLVRYLGAGDHGSVYEATWGREIVAVKFLSEEHISVEQIESLGKCLIDQGYVIQIIGYCYDEERDNHLVVMKKMDNSLEQMIRKRKDLGSECITVMLQVAKGLNFLNSKNISYAPLKASHILLKKGKSQNLEVKLSSAWLNYITSFQGPRSIFDTDVHSFATIFAPLLGPELQDFRDVLERCRDEDPIKRPRFEEICQRLYSYTPRRMKKLKLKELIKITDLFKSVVGQDDGVSYAGILENEPVEVRRIVSWTKNLESLLMISGMYHKNILSPGSYCLEGDTLYLVYQVMPNRDLDYHLIKHPTGLLGWDLRVKIAVDTAEGLEYLHANNVLHLDIKPYNILLDQSFRARIRMMVFFEILKDGDEEVDTVLRGTMGYLDPEFGSHGKASWKSDVYGFGVVLMNIVSGRRTVIFEEREVLQTWLTEALEQGRLTEALDPTLYTESFKLEQVHNMLQLALECTGNYLERPTFKEIVHRLKNLHSSFPRTSSSMISMAKGGNRTHIGLDPLDRLDRLVSKWKI